MRRLPKLLFILGFLLLCNTVQAAVTVNIYDGFQADLAKGNVDWANDTIKVGLLDSNHTFTASDDVWSDISANEISGTGYSAGGAALSNASVTEAAVTLLDADNTVWAGATFTARYAVLYDTTNSDSLIACVDFGQNESAVSDTFTLDWDDGGSVANAIITLTD